MAYVQLADIGYEPQSYNDYFIQLSTEKTAMLSSGLIRLNPTYNERASADGMRTARIPFLEDIDGEANISSDNPLEHSTPNSLGSGQDLCVILRRNNSWGSMDYVESVIKSIDPLGTVMSRLVAYWDRERQKTLSSVMQGIIASNIANNGSDMVIDISNATEGTKYHTYFFGEGAIALGFGRPKNPLSVERDESAGMGEGLEVLHTRHHYLMHPIGISWTDTATDVTKTPSNIDLANPVNWNRVYHRKYVRMACLISNAQVSGGVTLDNCISPDSVIDTVATMEDYMDGLTTMMCHSSILVHLKKLDLIDYIPYSEQGGMMIPTYNGMRVVVSNAVHSVSP